MPDVQQGLVPRCRHGLARERRRDGQQDGRQETQTHNRRLGLPATEPPESRFLWITDHALEPRNRERPRNPRALPVLLLLADVERMTVLQVEMKMGAMDVVGLWPEHGGEHAARTLVHPAQELGLRS
jgi:transposase InsO family protein